MEQFELRLNQGTDPMIFVNNGKVTFICISRKDIVIR